MRRCLRLLVVLAMITAPWAAGAQDLRIIPVPPGVKPQWTKVPGTPQVSWAPNIPTDVFRYRGTYYFFWEGYFYRGRTPMGPWKAVEKVPQVFYKVDPNYFKTAKKVKEAPAAPTVPAAPTPALPEPAPSPPGSPPEAPPPKPM